MTNFKEQWKYAKGKESRPQVTIVMNFTKPTADKPSLLTPYEVETFCTNSVTHCMVCLPTPSIAA